MLVWAKTLLSVYRYLDRVADAIDKIVFSRAINSFFTCGSNLAFNSVESVTDDILNLTERKVNLINLKLIIKNCLENTKSDLTPYLIANLIEGKTCFECVNIFNVSLRTYFRKLNLALESFIKTLARKGYDKTFFDNMLKDETWIVEVKNGFAKNINNAIGENFKVESKISLKQKKAIKSISNVTNVSPQTQNSQNF